jgi:hypothetical protein
MVTHRHRYAYRLWAGIKGGCYLLPAFLLVMLVYLWLVTYGTWQVFEPESFGQFQDAQAKSLLKGRLDVPRDAIANEVFIVNGKYYGYFGITPALLRLPLMLLFPGVEEGAWSRSSMAAACLLTLVASCLLLNAVRSLAGRRADGFSEKTARLAFVILVGLGSTNIFLACRAFVYHESLMWGAALGLLFYYLIIRYCISPNTLTLFAASAVSLLCVLARSTIGMGTLVTSALLALALAFSNKTLWPTVPAQNTPAEPSPGGQAVTRVRTKWDAAVLGVGILCALSLYMLINYLKFGTTLDGVPIRYHIAFLENPRILKQIDNKCFHLENLPFNIYSYLIRPGFSTSSTFPWLRPSERHVWPSVTKVLGCEPMISLPVCMPVFCILSIAGLYSTTVGRFTGTRLVLIPVLGALAAGFPMLCATGVTQRYLHDLFPFLVLASTFGLSSILSLPAARHRLGAGLVLFPLLCASIYINFAFSLYYQRVFIWGVAEARRAEFREWGKQIQALLQSGSRAEAILRGCAIVCLILFACLAFVLSRRFLKKVTDGRHPAA